MTDAEQVGAACCEVVSKIVGRDVALRSVPEPLHGGFWAQLWGLEFDGAPAPFDQPVVLRMMPDRNGGVREAQVQEALADSGFPTPRVLASGSTPGLGESYLLMRRINGRTPLGGLRIGPEIVGLPKLLRRLPAMLADISARLHAIDPNCVRDALDEGQVDDLSAVHPFRRRIEAAAAESPDTGFGAVIRWLDDHTPTAARQVICHGDLHPLNLLIDDVGATWLLDWTTATLAPKEMDIGMTAGLVRCAPIDAPGPLRPAIAWISNWLAERFIREVGSTSSVDRRAVDWWEAMQHTRCLAELTHGRLNPGAVVGPGHPFETSCVAMRHRLEQLTRITVNPPQRVH